ncbi:MAG: DnaJ domain-containing protein [Chloroflexota bacterium]|nr:DnaJ domain-containing protein [Chloroflexota bacterium]
MSDRDYYEVLGLTPRADGVMVDQAYWHLARKYQALATTNERGRRLLDELNEAYGVLGNARLRKEYDAFRDDVLVAGGVIGAVPSNPKRRASKQKQAAGTAAPPAGRRAHLPSGWRAWAAAAACAVAGGGAAVATGRAELAAAGIAVALIAGLTPALARRLAGLKLPALSLPATSLSMPRLALPAVPPVAMPVVKTPRVDLGRVGDHLGRSAERDDAIDPDELHASTSAVIARWRKSMGLRTSLREQASPGGEPTTELVEIVETERQIDEHESEPLMAVIDILRGAHKTGAAKRPGGSGD